MKKQTLIWAIVIIAIVALGYWMFKMKPNETGQPLPQPADSSKLTPTSPTSNQAHNQSIKPSNTATTPIKVAQVNDLIITTDVGTNTPSFIKAPSGEVLAENNSSLSQDTIAQQFLSANASLLQTNGGGNEFAYQNETKDMLGMTHLTYKQQYNGIEVYGAAMKAHFNQDGSLVSVNGKTIPNISIDTSPVIASTNAEQKAMQYVSRVKAAKNLNSNDTKLVVYNQQFIQQGKPGENKLAWNVEVSNGGTIREFVFVDAQNGKVINSISGAPDAMNRKVYDGAYEDSPGPNYSASPFWVEGNTYPTTFNNPLCAQELDYPFCNDEANQLIQTSKESYDFFSKTFGRDSFDGAGGTMLGIFDRGDNCPNASWNGEVTSYCPGVNTDDIDAHEWGHAYTEYTAGLLYAYQSGALNESYSDIWGDTVDQINGRGLDNPATPRTANGCSTFANNWQFPELFINSPSDISGLYRAQPAQFGPLISSSISGNVSVTTPADGCSAISEDLSGKIALINRGTCPFTDKVANAQAKGAIAVIVADNTPDRIAGVRTGNPDLQAFKGMGGVNPSITIPSVAVTLATGNTIRSALQAAPVNTTMRPLNNQLQHFTDSSYLWLNGEDAVDFGGVIRDLWNPICKGHAGKVSDALYFCFTTDSGGVHENSGISNHAYALLSDGGTYNGQTITGIGKVKAAHIQFRGLTTYLVPTSNFSDNADSLEASCRDLIGAPLKGFDGSASGQTITAADCEQVTKAIAAVEFRKEPNCGFKPILAKNPPPLCSTGFASASLFKDGFETGNSSTARWTTTHSDQTVDFTPREWIVTNSLPDNHTGHAFFGIDPNIGTCEPGGDESSVLHLDSPVIQVPKSVTAPKLAFDHYLATEPGWDGGNVKIKVNGGAWQLIKAEDFIYNPYNATLQPAPDNTNPMESQPAWTGFDGGTSEGSWGRSIINLTPYALPGSTIQIRFDMGVDGCTGFGGWYVDDVTVYSCRGK